MKQRAMTLHKPMKHDNGDLLYLAYFAFFRLEITVFAPAIPKTLHTYFILTFVLNIK